MAIPKYEDFVKEQKNGEAVLPTATTKVKDFNDFLKENNFQIQQPEQTPVLSAQIGSVKLNKLKNTAKQEKQKQKETEGALRNYLQQSGIQTSDTRFSTPNTSEITSNMLQQSRMTLDPKQLNNPVYTDAYGNTADIFQASQSNALKYNQLMQTDEAKQKVEDIKKQVTKAGFAQYEYDKEAVNQDEIGWFDKSLGNITRALESFVDSGGEIYDEKGNSLRLPSRNELKSQKVNESYDTFIGRVLGNLTYEGTRILASTALNAVVPYAGSAWYFTDMFNDSYNSARRDGYDGDKAVLYATLSTASEVVVGKILGSATKKLTGGKSGKVDVAVKKFLTRFLGDNKVTDFLANASAEAAEEFVQEYIDNINKKAVLEGSKNVNDYLKILTDENVFYDAGYSALLGAMTGGTLGGHVDVNQDLKTNISKNNEEITKLSNQKENTKNKTELKKINEDIKKLEEENAKYTDQIAKNIEKYKLKDNGVITVEDLVNQEKNQKEQLPKLDIRLQQRLEGQPNLPKQSYTTDVTNYTGSQLKTYQNAINSGLLNNNKNAHDFVDFVGKISKDKDVVFNFTNNQALQDRNIDAQINGFIDKDGITINIDSIEALEKVIGHEVTHTLESMANEYNELKESFKTLLGDEYNTRLEQIKELYKGVEDANYENELISDLVGEYLFTNEEFINNLLTEKPSLFKKIYNEIKYLWKMATGTAYEKQLAKTMRIYENAYRNAGKVTTPSTQYSLSQDNQGRKLSEQQQEYFKDSKVRDEEGRLVPVYHMTNADFTKIDFDKNFQGIFWFASSKEDLQNGDVTATGTRDKANSKIMELYANIKKPAGWLEYDNYGIGQLKEMGYDGAILREEDGSFVGFVFNESNQIKNIDNTNPTDNPDIRYQISEKTENLPKGQFKGKTVRRDTNIPTTQESALNVPVNKPRSELKAKSVIPLVKNNKILKEESQRIANEINEKGEFTIKTKGWLKTATESEALKGKVYIQDLDPSKVSYVVQSNQESLNKANKHLDTYGYEKSLDYVNNLMQNDGLPKASDVALMQRMIQEAAKRGDSQTVQDLIMDTAILGTDLGQATQALSIIKRLTPEGQLAMYTKLVERAKSRGEKSFNNVEITPKMVENLLDAYNEDGTYDQDDLNARVEQFKQDLADQMKATIRDKVDAWRYLSMLGNPKTHIRNIVSNVAMTGTIKVKNAMARTLETLLPVKERTKTWKQASNDVKEFSKQTATNMKDVITGENKYNEKSAIESKKQIFKNKTLEKLSDFNGKALEAEDWFFSKRAFQSTLQEYLTANGINTYEDIENNPELVEKAKIYAVEQAEIATFRQYSKLAATINQIEKKNKAARVAVQATIPFKKTPINVAKAGVNYSPLGLIKNISYDVYQLKQGNINASQFIDNLSQGLTGTSLTLLGYALAKAGILTGSGGDDKDDKYDKQLGKTGYSLNIGGNSYSISWLSPVAMPLLVGSNAYEQLEEQKEWDMNVVSDTLAKTLDPLNEMSFLQGLTNALQSYGSGTDKIKGALESTAQNYAGQFFPTIFSQLAATIDTKKRSTKASNDSTYKFGEQTVRSIMYKIPGLRQQLEVATDMWGNEKEQSNNIIERAFESFIAPYSKTKDITTDLDKEIKRVYNETGESGVIPSVPYAYVRYKNETYKMSAKEYTEYKKTYGQNASKYLNNLIDTDVYKNATENDKAKMIDNIYDYAKAEANEQYFKLQDIDYTSDTLEELNKLKNIGINSKTLPEYVANKTQLSSIRNNENYSSSEKHQKVANNLINSNLNDKQLAFLYDKYYASTKTLNNLLNANVPIKEFIKLNSQEFEADYDNRGKAISGSKEKKYINYVNSLDLSIPQKAILIKMQYKSFNNYDKQIVNYVNNLNLSAIDKAMMLKQFNMDNFDSYIISDIMKRNISASEKEQILKDLGFNVRNGVVYK